MALTTHRDLMLYELGKMRDAETTGGRMLGWLGSETSDSELGELLREQVRESHEHLSSIEECLHSLGGSPLETPSDVVEGMRTGYARFRQMRPSREVLDLYGLMVALRFTHFAVGTYKGLLCGARIMKESTCEQILERNLVQKEQSATELDQKGQRMAEHLANVSQ